MVLHFTLLSMAGGISRFGPTRQCTVLILRGVQLPVRKDRTNAGGPLMCENLWPSDLCLTIVQTPWQRKKR